MTSEEIFKTMQDLIAEQFAVNADDVTMNSSFEDDLSADSVDLVELVMAMEEEFEIDEIPEEDLLTLKTVGDCVRYLTAKLNWDNAPLPAGRTYEKGGETPCRNWNVSWATASAAEPCSPRLCATAPMPTSTAARRA